MNKRVDSSALNDALCGASLLKGNIGERACDIKVQCI